QAWIEAKRVPDEIVQSRQGLDPSEPAAGYNEGRQPIRIDRALGIRFLERRDHAISKMNGVAKRLHRQRTSFEPWQAVEVRDGSEREHQMVERELVWVPVQAMRHDHAASTQVNRFDISNEYLGAPQQRTNRTDDVCDVDVA